jgi:Tfp pilus assembly protein PilW
MRNTRLFRDEAGFTLAELMVSTLITLAIMGATVTTLSQTYRQNESAKAILSINNYLRIGADIMEQDFLQVGQGLPTGRIIQVPNGGAALPIQQPHPQGSTCTQWPVGTVAIPAVTPGPGCGPTINGVATDTVTTMATDSMLYNVPIASFNLVARSATVATAAQANNGLNIATGQSTDVAVGDLMMFTKGSMSALVYVTGVTGNQTFSFAGGDPMNLNQTAANFNGTVDDLANTVPTTAYSAEVSRVFMISYYLDNTLDPANPRLIRQTNWGNPAVAVNQRGMTVAFDVENLQLSYDIVNSLTNPAFVRMVANDLTVNGACAPQACSPNQIRKVNISLAGRSELVSSVTKKYFRNSLDSQVSLRSMALVNLYQ